jgi:hypothetical protein
MTAIDADHRLRRHAARPHALACDGWRLGALVRVTIQ